MLYTDLKEGQFVKIGDVVIRLMQIKDHDARGSPKARLEIDAPKAVKIQFDNSKKPSNLN